MASRNQPLASMNPMQHRDTTVKVRVVRLWYIPPYSSNMSKPNPGAVAIQMVLCDSENCTIGASVPSVYLNKFKGSLVEGGVYFISRFGVGRSGGNFRITTHAFKINFQFGTRVMPTIDDPEIHKHGFEWVKAESITSGNADEKTLVAPMSTTIPRFRLELVVIDDTAPANFTLFDRDAAIFLGVSTEFMKNKAAKVDDDSTQSLTEFDKFLGIRFVFKVGVKLAMWSPTPLLTVQAMSWDQDLIKKLSPESPLDICVFVSCESLTPNQEAEKINLDKESANTNNAMEGRYLSFSEEVTSEDRYTTSGNMGNSSEESNTKRRVNDVNGVNTVSQDVLKKVKLEKL
ncbi:replication protein A 70 kDa DNA-binding subunit B-like [Senna tora]|uniref:Replication protein A 70 kDa DNA-binding subunit B-like n=1 Tax=Senna tora TaxID=362788 RepID=A0A834T8T4_9FABA|nr:replication protein A 70 kDa DNA-binding subunit B-like [Senna tora]